jgi:hypothetical protein
VFGETADRSGRGLSFREPRGIVHRLTALGRQGLSAGLSVAHAVLAANVLQLPARSSCLLQTNVPLRVSLKEESSLSRGAPGLVVKPTYHPTPTILLMGAE